MPVRFYGARDLDHTSANVQKNVNAYLDFLKNDLGYTGFRYDFVKGYAAKYVGQYNATAKPEFSVGECWDGYTTITSWINGTKVKIQNCQDSRQVAYFHCYLQGMSRAMQYPRLRLLLQSPLQISES